MVSRMTPKQQQFVNEYLVDLNATQAAIRAGYSAKTAEQQGYQLLQHPSVRQAVDQALAERAERTAVTQDWVVGKLVENTDMAMRAVPVLDREGNPTGEYTYQGAVANGSLKLLGQHLGMFKDRVEHSGPDGGPIVVEDRSASLADLVSVLKNSGAIPSDS